MKWPVLLLLIVLGFVVLFGALGFIDQAAWRIMWRCSQYVATLGALASAVAASATVVAAVAAFVYVLVTYRLWQETQAQVRTQQRTAEAALMQGLMVEYDKLRNSIQAVHDWWSSRGERAVEFFRQGMEAPDWNNEARRLDRHRFRVSRFFVKVRKLAQQGFLAEDLLRATLDRAAIEIFLEKVDPLDQQIVAIGGRPVNTADQDYFAALLQRYQ